MLGGNEPDGQNAANLEDLEEQLATVQTEMDDLAGMNDGCAHYSLC